MAFLFDFGLIDSNHCEISPYSITLLILTKNDIWSLISNRSLINISLIKTNMMIDNYS